jgi:hypothetical protein
MELRIATMQAVMRAFINGARGWVVGVALAKAMKFQTRPPSESCANWNTKPKGDSDAPCRPSGT